MTKTLLLLSTAAVFLVSCAPRVNPLLEDYGTPFDMPPFEQIRVDDYLPAFQEGIAQTRAEVDAIVSDSADPTFANTVEALEAAGPLLDRVADLFYSLNNSNTGDEMQAVAREVAPLLTELNSDINMNPELFRRVKVVYGQKDQLDLTAEQATLLKDTYRNFVRGGANLDAEQQARLREIDQELALLSLEFGDNVLAENNRFELVLENEADLAGLPANVVTTAAETAAERDHEGKWVFTIHKPSLLPFLTYSERRDLREQMFKAYITKGDHADTLDNNGIVSKIASLRVQRAKLLGYPTHAHYVLEENMAKTPDQVYKFLDQLWKPAQKRARDEVAAMQAIIDAGGGGFKLQPWDWWYYAEKVRKEKYALDDELLRPYFQLDKVQQGAFDVANKLWGITFTKVDGVPLYDPGVTVYEVRDADGSHLGLYMTDYHPRASKTAGAWMGNFRDQSNRGGQMVRPLVYNVFNFSRPTGDQPALISLEEVETLFHEFGHALQGLLTDCTYEALSGTAVSRDYVELCSQIMENWGTEPEVLKSYAVHWQTGETIPDELVERIRQAALFNQGFLTVEYLAASYLDMDWHTLKDAQPRDTDKFEAAVLKRIALIPEIAPRYHSTYFLHPFVWGYSSGYYSYVWAEVLDADAFEAFREKGLFDQATAAAFREHILETGGTEEPMVLYQRFRGREPEIAPLLKRRGLD